MKILILEDSKERIRQFKQRLIGHVVTITDNAKICIEHLKDEEWDYLFLDHDLSSLHYALFHKGVPYSAGGTGNDVCKFLAANPERKPKQEVLLHSFNPVGVQNMYKTLKDKVPVRITPELWLRVNELKE